MGGQEAGHHDVGRYRARRKVEGGRGVDTSDILRCVPRSVHSWFPLAYHFCLSLPPTLASSLRYPLKPGGRGLIFKPCQEKHELAES
jgi:hypothetical protein